MAHDFSIFIAQTNVTLGALAENAAHLASWYKKGVDQCADLVLTPELSLTGYPLEDLVLKPFFVRSAMKQAGELAKVTAEPGSPGLIVGCPWSDEKGLHNAVLLMAGGEIAAIRYKHELPNYGVFDELRVFRSGPLPKPIVFRGVSLGVMVCEDMWFPQVSEHLKSNGAQVLLVPTCSPFQVNKYQERLEQSAARIKETGLPLVFCNQICGQDELVFEGASYVQDIDGELKAQLPAWREDGVLTKWTMGPSEKYVRPEAEDLHTIQEGSESIYQAMLLGLRDYVNKNRFPGVVLGLSGGVDSALSAAVAVDALGADRVHCVMMPSRYTSGESLGDAEGCVKLLNVRYDVIPIKEGVHAFDSMLSDVFSAQEPDTTEENIQSRLRGLILMSLSNKFGNMVLTTGNKSELSVGYATLYGDMCGGYNALKDVYKLDVFELCRWRNENMPAGAMGPNGLAVPTNIITKAPTAELREDQRDDDSLPPYERLDAILRCLVDDEMAVSDVVACGHDASEVARIEQLLYIAEYKRRQSPPGVKITRKNFGRDRRYPITNGFRSARF